MGDIPGWTQHSTDLITDLRDLSDPTKLQIPDNMRLWLLAARAANAANEIEMLRTALRKAFRAGWMTNAVPPDEHEAGADYVLKCEEYDWKEWSKGNVRQS